MNDQLKLTFHIFAELNKVENAIFVYKRNTSLFIAMLERVGIATQISNAGDTRDKFVFINDGQAEQLFNTWKD